jgi:imidazolonepropionase
VRSGRGKRTGPGPPPARPWPEGPDAAAANRVVDEEGHTSLLIRGARVVSPPDGAGYLRGKAMAGLDIRPGTDVLVQGGRIQEVAKGIAPRPGARVVEAEGRVLVPGFVDAHTHACWAGSRLDEWDLRRRGASYPEILAAGGGILSTVRAVRETPEVALAAALRVRLGWMLREGTTAVEVKSGYGLDAETELKMLRAIRRAGRDWPGRVVPTACIGHAVDPGVPDHVTTVVDKVLPAVHEEFPGIAIDAYCEEGAWSVQDCVRLFQAARELGHPLRIHADQFNSLGMVPKALELGARSIDHLEASTREDLGLLARSSAAGVVLPVSGFHLDDRYADARALVDEGGAVVVATNWNPGSAPSPSIPLAMALAVRKNGLEPHEALTAVTANPAHLLGLADAGRIVAGRRADLVLLRHRDERELAHTLGGSPVLLVVCGGRVVGGPVR